MPIYNRTLLVDAFQNRIGRLVIELQRALRRARGCRHSKDGMIEGTVATLRRCDVFSPVVLMSSFTYSVNCKPF